MKQDELGPIVRIGDSKNTEIYEHAILRRAHPKVYNKNKHIIIQVIASRYEFAKIIINRFFWLGLNVVKEKQKDIKVVNKNGESYILKDAYEIKLKKLPILEMRGEDWEESY